MISTSISNISLCIISNTVNLINGIMVMVVLIKDKKVHLLKATIIYVYVSLLISMSISVIFTIMFVRNDIDDSHLSTNREILLINKDIANYIAYVCFGPTTYSTIWTQDTNGKDQQNIFHILVKLYESKDQVPLSVWIFMTMIKRSHFELLLIAQDISGMSPLAYIKLEESNNLSCNKGEIIEQCKRLVPQIDQNDLRELEQKAQEIADSVLTLNVIGIANSGKSTLQRQLQIAYTKGFYERDLIYFKESIYYQILYDLDTIIEQTNQDSDMNDLSNEMRILNEISHVITNITPDVCLAIQKLWKADIIKNTYKSKRNEMFVSDSTKYFLDDFKRIAHHEYLPSFNDVLLHYERTMEPSEHIYKINENRFRVIDFGGTKVERRKRPWNNFGKTDGFIFIASLSCYNEVLWEDDLINAMDDTLHFFEERINDRIWKEIPFILFLNKSDIFKEKIKEVPITVCDAFNDYNGNANDYNECIEYIKGKFNDLNKNNEREIKIYVTCAINEDSIKNAFDDATKWVIQYNSKGYSR